MPAVLCWDAGIYTKVDRAEDGKAIAARINGTDPHEFRPKYGSYAVRNLFSMFIKY